MWSVPARFAIFRSTSNEPLGACVVREPVKARLPLSAIATDQCWPLRFESISTSTSTRPSSCLALSFQTVAEEQWPALRTSRSWPPLACAAPAPPPTRAMVSSPAAAVVMVVRFMVILQLWTGCPGVVTTLGSATDAVPSGIGRSTRPRACIEPSWVRRWHGDSTDLTAGRHRRAGRGGRARQEVRRRRTRRDGLDEAGDREHGRDPHGPDPVEAQPGRRVRLPGLRVARPGTGAPPSCRVLRERREGGRRGGHHRA